MDTTPHHFRVSYEVRSLISSPPEILASGSVTVGAASPDAARAAARSWVEEHVAAYDPRVDPVVAVVDIEETGDMEG